MSVIKRYTDLVAWQKAMDLVQEVYQITKSFSREELYSLTSQVRRSAVSIPSNIAEGHCRNGRREFAHHLSIALGSLGETETQMLIAHRLEYLTAEALARFEDLASETGRLLVGLTHSLERHAAAS
ncbi:MAG: four helix bundle protein [Bryobacteraceae bacterium]